tara:strand:+ start:953 stop:1144 length:192 start_codon:yes stop_codon:yes gene_type:complete
MIDLNKTKFFNIKDIAEILRCSTTKVYLLRDAGKIKMHKNVAGLWVATEEEVVKLIENETYSN